MLQETSDRLLPTGECWCGCGSETRRGSFFIAGHDKTAESGVILSEWGSVAHFLQAHGFGPEGRNARDELNAWRERNRRS